MKQSKQKKPTLLRKGGYQYELTVQDVENQLDKKSMTVPDQSYSVKDLLDKSKRGIDLGIDRNPQYSAADMSYDDDDVEKVSRLDINDKHQLQLENARKLRELKREQDSRKKSRDDKAAKKAEQQSERLEATTKEEAKEAKPTVTPAAEKSEQK